ncbi:MAG: hypothetical protein LUG86_08980 [Oscillospiraceae bacterium]|nr:hypothetical protein [Oscillospiraceae bacterium]
MNDFIERTLSVAEQYKLTELQEKLKNISEPENAPYLKVAIISSLNRLANLIAGEDILPDKLIVANQEIVCITFDGSDDEKYRTIHVKNERWEGVPIRFYAIIWDKAFYDDLHPSKVLDDMDFMIFGMDAATAFRRSMIDLITSTRAWDSMIVIEGLEKIPEDENDEFIKVCLKRTENLNMTSEQLVLWDNSVSYVAIEQISSKILSRWKSDEETPEALKDYRKEKFEDDCKRWVSAEMKAALWSKINEYRERLNAERQKLHANRQITERCQEVASEMDCWIADFEKSLDKEIAGLLSSISQSYKKALSSGESITQNTIDILAENTKTRWETFAGNQVKLMEASLMAKMSELRLGYNLPDGNTAGSVGKTTGTTAVSVDAPRSLWYCTILLIDVGLVSSLILGPGLTVLLSFPVLKIKRDHDKKVVTKKLEESNSRTAGELKNAFHKDLQTCKRNAVALFEEEFLSGTEVNVSVINQLSDTIKKLCDLLDEYSIEK